MKPTSTFKLSKTSKRMLATYVDKHLRGEVKRSMIQAELFEAVVPKSTKGDRDNKRPQQGTTSSTGYVAPDSLT